MVHREVDVVVTNKKIICAGLFFLLSAVTTIVSVSAAVLPDERIDFLYHGYEGGGAEISGPSVLIRKNIGSSVSVTANYYVDMVTSASIDVVTNGKQGRGVDLMTGATQYSEERKEQGFSAQYMVDRSTMSVGYTSSKENDYDATTYSLGIDQSFFGDLTTLGFGVSFGDDIVRNNYDETYLRELQRRKYSLNASQIITKNLLTSFSIDSASDQCLNLLEEESCLNNPYRQYRYENSLTGSYLWDSEKYPHTRNSDAVGVRAVYHLPWRGSVRTDFRSFKDSWGIEAQNYEIRYTHVYRNNWIIEGKFRGYQQKTGANFYSDLFPFEKSQNFMARDKELSPFTSTVIGLGVTYKLPNGLIPWVEKSAVNLYWDHFNMDYDDFRDARYDVVEFGAGTEPLYSLQADVIRFYLSFWF